MRSFFRFRGGVRYTRPDDKITWGFLADVRLSKKKTERVDAMSLCIYLDETLNLPYILRLSKTEECSSFIWNVIEKGIFGRGHEIFISCDSDWPMKVRYGQSYRAALSCDIKELWYIFYTVRKSCQSVNCTLRSQVDELRMR